MKRFIEKEEFFTLGKSSAEYHPVWDYEPHTSPSLLSMEAYETAFPQAEELSHQLNISPIALYFIEDQDLEGHLARYINGTSFSPVIVLTDRVHDIDEAHLTLFHELGHAYIDSVGGRSGDKSEEDVVETFAHVAYMEGLSQAVAFLKAEVSEKESEQNIPSQVMEEIRDYLDSAGKDIYEIGMELDVIPASSKNDLDYWLRNKVGREGEPPDEELMDEICQDGKITTPIIIDSTSDHTVEGRHRLAAALKCGLDVPAVILFAKEGDEEGY